MSQARTFKVTSNLARQIHEPGGRRVADAQRLAGEALEAHREAAMTAIAATLTGMEKLCDEGPEGVGDAVYAQASSIVDLAGYFDTGPLFEAAYSLCEVVDRMNNAQTWGWPAVQVHVQAMRLILAGGCRAGRASETLLAGLRSVTESR